MSNSDSTTVELYLAGLSALLAGADSYAGTDKRDSTSLGLWLRRAVCQRVAETDLLRQFCKGVNIVCDDARLPLAALSYYYHYDASPLHVLYIDPVYLKPDRDHLILFGPKSVQLSLPEARLLIEEIVTFYQDLGWKIECQRANSWMLVLENPSAVSFSPLADVTGKSIGDYLPRGGDKRHWRGISNEIQMLLHNNSTNLSREQSGRLPANSVWFWGEGSLQSLHQSQALDGIEGLWTDNSSVAGLGKLAGLSVKELPADASMCIQNLTVQSKQKIFIDLDDWFELSNESFSQVQQLKVLQQVWIAPLMNALVDKHIGQLHLYDDRGRCFSINQRQLKHWWKRVRPLNTFL